MYNKVKLYVLSTVLTVIGALNWGLVGLLNFDLVAAIFGKKSFISRLIYILVVLAGVCVIIIGKEEYLNLKRWGLIKSKQESENKSESTGMQHNKYKQDHSNKHDSTGEHHYKSKQHYKGKFYSTGENHFKGKH
jgi:uncharacterized membrane protein YuzA (DUF378 family)